MPVRKIDDLRQAIRQKRLENLYLLHGPESFLRDAAARTLTDLALADAPLRAFNDTVYSLAQTNVQQALATAEQLPMMGGHRVVRLLDCHKLREADEEALLRYLANPVETTVVLFVADELDKRRRLAKALLEKCYAVEFAALSDIELQKWARRHLREAQVSLDDRTLAHIIGMVGSDVRTLANELDKLATAAAGNGVITWELADALVGRSRELSNFALSDNLLARDRPRALQTLRLLLDDRAEPVMLLGLLASHYHRLLLAKELKQRGAPREEVFRLVAMPYHKREEFLTQARRCDAKELERCINLIAAADLAVKTSQATPRLQLELLVCSLTA